MDSQLKNYLALGLVLAAPLIAAESTQRITVMVYNYALVSSEVLAQTETEAARIYHRGSIEIQWLDCPLSANDSARFPACQGTAGATRLALRILPQSMAESLRQVQDSYGFALYPEDGSFAILANIFARDAEQLAQRRGMRHGVILGHLLAHEMGHLLLGAGSHSRHGIMCFPWRARELETIAQGLMMFTPEDLQKIRSNISARIAAESPR